MTAVKDSEQTSSIWMTIKRRIETAAGIAVFAWFLWYLLQHIDTLKPILTVSWINICGLTIAIVITWTLNSAQAHYLLRVQGIQIGHLELFLVFAGITFANYLPLRPGTVLRLHYLKKVHGVRYARALSITGTRTVILMWVTGLSGLIGTVGIFLVHGRLSLQLVSIFAFLTFFSFAAYYQPLPQFKNPGATLPKIWNDFLDGYTALRKDPSTALHVMLIIMLQLICVAVRLYLSFDALNLHPSILILMLLAPLSVLLLLLAITPGGIGLREGIIGYITLTSGYDFESGFFAATVDRAMLLLVTLSLGATGFYYSWSRMKRATS